MCGLAGFLNFRRHQSADEMLAISGRMANTIRHRGPDDEGLWCDPATGVALAFRRLSIVDLTPSGHQPMSSSCGRFMIAFNGEIYNHNELRRELVAQGHSFRGRSDTEVLVEGFGEWGIEATVTRCVGMFAIAAWDVERRELTLIRDRLGKKPLYYGRFDSTLLFGSETKALRAHPAFHAEIDREAIGEFLRNSYLTHRSIYRGITPLTPGTSITFRLDDESVQKGEHRSVPDHSGQTKNSPIEKAFWDFRQVARNGLQHPFKGSYEAAVERLDELLTDAVGRRMVADVPLGAFLSGGIDSSLVVALMQKQSPRPVRTFTIGFDEDAFNEAPYAQRVAQHLKTDHSELYVTSNEARDVIPQLPTLFDEPFGDSSQIPTYLVSRLARRDVTVALSGDGGDELFCGYRRYFEALEGFFPSEPGSVAAIPRAVAVVRSMPIPVRRAIAATCGFAGTLPLGRLARLLSRASDIFGETGPHSRYLRNLSHWRDRDAVVTGICRIHPDSALRDLSVCSEIPPATPSEFQQAWQAYDTLNYLPGDILTKVDRASMGVSLEARTPLLDHRVVEFAWSLPREYTVQGRSGKRILRDVLAKYVPRELFERPKVGFGVPVGDWLRGPLRDWAEELLGEARLKREGFLNPSPIRQKWRDHLHGRTDWSYLLWDVLMFQAWLAAYPEISN